MTFKEVLAQVIDWLQQDRRVSYRALKRQFTIDDDFLADLKYEITEVQQLAIDRDSTVLVWTGEARVAAALGLAYALDGRVAAGLPLVEHGVEQAVARGRWRSLAHMVACLSEAYLLAGRLEEARQRAAQAGAYAMKRGHCVGMSISSGCRSCRQEP